MAPPESFSMWIRDTLSAPDTFVSQGSSLA